MVVLTARQREQLATASLNTGNAILVAWVLTNVLGQSLQWPIALAGLTLFGILIAVALWVNP